MEFFSQKNILLSISILISNRPDTVEKCLRSLESLREKIPSELILVDTGCGEQVRKIVELYADKIVDFEWCNDFAKARNAGLKLAKGEWFLYLDDDEWFENTDEIEDFFLSGKHLQYNYGIYLARNYLDPEGKKYRDEYVGRLIRLEPDTEFVHSIHEVFSEVKAPWIRLHSYVHHYGYAFKNEEEARKHSKRNIELLLAEHEKAPRDLRHIAQLVQEYNGIEEWDKSIEISWEGIHNAEPGISADQFMGGLYANITGNYVALKQYSDAIKVGEEYLKLDCSNALDRAVVYYDLSIAYLKKDEYAKSLMAAERYQDFYGKWKENRDETAFYEHLSLPFLNERCKQTALCVAVQDGIKLENTALAKQYFNEIDWNVPNALDVQRVQDMIQVLVKVWLCKNADAAQEYTAMMRVLLKNGKLARMVVTEIDSLWKCAPEFLKTKKADWEALADAHWIFLYFKLKNGLETDKGVLKEEYCKLWKEPKDILMRAEELNLWEMSRQDGVEMQQVISSIPMWRWERAMKTSVEELDWQDVQKIQGHLAEELDADSFYMLYWSIPYRMRKVCNMAANIHDSTESIVQELLEYAEENKTLYRKLYREEVFREMPELLPQECQVSLKLSDMAEAADRGEFQQALFAVRETLEIMPELSDALKCCTKWISEKSAAQDAEQENAKKEMRKLAEAVKMQVRSMVAQGMLNEAAGILHQLKALVPEDEEMIQMETELLQK